MSFSFLVGGARSGKSTLAVDAARRADARGESVSVVVTAEALDDEMTARIDRHIAERPAHWKVFEAPRSLKTIVSELPVGFVVVDCVSFWVANLVMDGVDDIEEQASEIALVLAAREGAGVVVSNEVGLGLVPENELGRRFRDVLGRVNVLFAEAGDRSYLVVAGRLLNLGPAGDFETG